jgi:protein transport protein SEC24
VNQVPRTYQCGLDQYGRRRDFYERPELRFGSCDFAVPAAYNVRATPQVPTFVFIVDVSFHAVANGALQACVDAISDALEDLPEDSTTRVGLITFDDAVHFYDIKVCVCVSVSVSVLFYTLGAVLRCMCVWCGCVQGEIAGMTAVVDVDDVFCPLPESNWLPPLETSRPTLLELLKRLPAMFGATRVLQSCMGAAVKSAVFGLQDIGGRVTVFHSHLPTIGEGKLVNRENIRAYGAADTEKPMYLPDEKSSKFYSDLATSAAGRQIGIDMFACGSLFCDLATTGVLANTTGGEIRRVAGFKRPSSSTVSIAASGGPPTTAVNGVQTAALHEDSLDKHAQEEVARSQSEAADSLCTQFWALFHRNYGFEAVMKVRCSQGLRVGEYIGAYCNRTGMDADLALVDSDKAVAVSLVHDGSGLKPGGEAYIQCALLYTTPHRQRRVRVHTLCLMASADMAAVFKNADYEAVLNLIIRRRACSAVVVFCGGTAPILSC